MTKNLISVIIPTYNRAHLIKRSATSVLNQTYVNLELIIVDDGSTDNTEDVVKSIGDNRIIYIKQQNQGACAARNNGITHAQGDYIAFQDSDDVWHENKLEKQLNTLKQKNADMVVCGISAWITPRKKYDVYLIYKNTFLDDEKWPYSIGTQTFFAKSRVFKQIQFDENVLRWQDFEILTRIQKTFTIYCSNDILVDYFITSERISNNHRNLLNTLKMVFIQNKNALNLRRKYNNDIAVYIVYNLKKCTDKDIEKKISTIAYEISNNPFYIKMRYFLMKTGVHSFLQKIYHLFK